MKLIRFGSTLSAYLDRNGNLFIYNPASGKVVKKYTFSLISLSQLFEASNNMQYAFFEGFLYDLYNYNCLKGIKDLYFAKFSPCNKYFNCIDGDN